MPDSLIDRATAAISRSRSVHPLGRVTAISGGRVHLSGLDGKARLGDRARLTSIGGLPSEIVQFSDGLAHALPEGPIEGLSVGDRVRLEPAPAFAPDDGWIGRVIDPDGRPLDERPLLPGRQLRPIHASPPAPHARRAMGARLSTGLAVFDTLLPIVRGQRIGLFAGSGVGKSTLIGDLARGVEADVIVIGLVGERGRELRDFLDRVLGPEGLARSVVVAATSDRAPQIRRRCAAAAMTVAEHFRDSGRHVLLLLDSVTRFAEAHRELAVAAGEAAALRGFPASTGPSIAALCERAGPGAGDAGDITAIFSVLVAGSDMEEPVADMLRGVLDGHVVLDRQIAERGRFPAVDLVRSVSRSLPDAATAAENAMIAEARRHLATYDRAELMIQSGLYTTGADPAIDGAIARYPALDAFLAERAPRGVAGSFSSLRRVLAAGAGGDGRRPAK